MEYPKLKLSEGVTPIVEEETGLNVVKNVYGRSVIESKLFAARIVDCWNSHDALVEALEECSEYMNYDTGREERLRKIYELLRDIKEQQTR